MATIGDRPADIKPLIKGVVGSLKNSASLLKMIGDMDDVPSSLKRTTKSLATSIVKLLKKVRDKNMDEIGESLEDLYSKFMMMEVRDDEVDILLQLIESGMSPALSKAVRSLKVKTECPECKFQIPAYTGRYPKHCPECGEPLDIKNEGKSTDLLGTAILELFFVNRSLKKESELDLAEMQEFIGGMGVPVREGSKTIALRCSDQDDDVSQLMLNVISYAFSKDEDKSALEKETKALASSLGSKAVVEWVQSQDVHTQAAWSPILHVMDHLMDWDVLPAVATPIKDQFDGVYSTVAYLKQWALTLENDMRQDVWEHLSNLYDLIPTILDVGVEYTTEQAADLALQLVGKDTLATLRNEVAKRDALHKNVKTLEIDEFDMDQAVKAFSSCLTRVTIQAEQEKRLELDVLKSLTFEKMSQLLSGRKIEPVNFLKGVFLDEAALSQYQKDKRYIYPRELQSYLTLELKAKGIAIDVDKNDDGTFEATIKGDSNKEPVLIFANLVNGNETGITQNGSVKDSYIGLKGGAGFNDYDPNGNMNQQLTKIVKAIVAYVKSDYDKSTLEKNKR